MEDKYKNFNPAPWTNDLTPMIKAGAPKIKLNGCVSRADLRVLSEDNFRYAMHRVNLHDDLIAFLGKSLSTLEAYIKINSCDAPILYMLVESHKQILKKAKGIK